MYTNCLHIKIKNVPQLPKKKKKNKKEKKVKATWREPSGVYDLTQWNMYVHWYGPKQCCQVTKKIHQPQDCLQLRWEVFQQ